MPASGTSSTNTAVAARRDLDRPVEVALGLAAPGLQRVAGLVLVVDRELGEREHRVAPVLTAVAEQVHEHVAFGVEAAGDVVERVLLRVGLPDDVTRPAERRAVDGGA